MMPAITCMSMKRFASPQDVNIPVGSRVTCEDVMVRDDDYL